METIIARFFNFVYAVFFVLFFLVSSADAAVNANEMATPVGYWQTIDDTSRG